MRIFSWNVNGLRAIHQKGFLNWLDKTNPDVLCLQEIKAQPDQLPKQLIKPSGYHSYFHPATKKGYSGVLVYTKIKPSSTRLKLNFKQFDQEGRFIQLNFPQFSLLNLYLPHGQRNQKKLPYKLKAYQKILYYLKKIKNKPLLIAGDFNVAHQEADLARPKQNQNNTMFTPEERKQLDKLVKMGFTDSFRKFHLKGGHYTWWPYTHNARQRNLGWRLDYIFSSEKLTPKLKKAFILKNISLSDHCPIGINLD